MRLEDAVGRALAEAAARGIPPGGARVCGSWVLEAMDGGHSLSAEGRGPSWRGDLSEPSDAAAAVLLVCSVFREGLADLLSCGLSPDDLRPDSREGDPAEAFFLEVLREAARSRDPATGSWSGPVGLGYALRLGDPGGGRPDGGGWLESRGHRMVSQRGADREGLLREAALLMAGAARAGVLRLAARLRAWGLPEDEIRAEFALAAVAGVQAA